MQATASKRPVSISAPLVCITLRSVIALLVLPQSLCSHQQDAIAQGNHPKKKKLCSKTYSSCIITHMICLFMLWSFSLSRACRRICLLYPLLFWLVPQIRIKPAFPQWMNGSQEAESTAVIFPAICSRDSSQLCTRLCTSPDAPSSAATWKAERRDLFAWHGCPEPGGTWMWLQRSRNGLSHQPEMTVACYPCRHPSSSERK